MKKLILSLGALLIIMFCKAQSIPAGTLIWSEDFDSARWAQSVSPFDTNTLTGNVLISQDLMPYGWTVGDATGNNFFWHWSRLGPRGRYTSFDGVDPWSSYLPTNDPKKIIQSSTKNNGFMVLESDYFNSINYNPHLIPKKMDSYILSPPIDLSNIGIVFLKFEQNFRICCPETAKISVFVSNDYNLLSDSAHWLEYDARLNTSANSFSNNPSVAVFNISEMAAGHDSV